MIVIYAELDNKRDGNSAFRMHENRRLCIANESPSECQTEMEDSADAEIEIDIRDGIDAEEVPETLSSVNYTQHR